MQSARTIISFENLKKLFKFMLFVVVFAAVVYVCFFLLGKPPLENWDEAWYADIVRTMIRTRKYIVPVWNQTILFDKPPLQMWLTIPFLLTLGTTELSIRLVSAIAGSLTVLFVTVYAYKKWGLLPALFSVLSLLFNNVFIWRTRSGNIDALAAFLICCIYFATVSKYKYREIIVGVLFGLMYLAKASLVAFPIFVFLLHELLFQRQALRHRFKSYLLGLLLAVTLAGIWLYLGYREAGSGFATYYLFHSDQNVTHISLRLFKTDYISYLYYALQRRFSYLFAVGLIFCLISLFKKSESFLIVSFSLLLLILLSFTERNNNWYVIPSMPFWSLAIGYGIYKSKELIQTKSQLFTYVVFVPLTLISLFISYKTFMVNINPIIHATGPVYQMESSRLIKTFTSPDEIVVRADVEYPTAVYYSERKILSYRSEVSGPHATFIGTADLLSGIQNKKYRWIFGPKQRVIDLIPSISNLSLWENKYENSEEVIMYLK